MDTKSDTIFVIFVINAIWAFLMIVFGHPVTYILGIFTAQFMATLIVFAETVGEGQQAPSGMAFLIRWSMRVGVPAVCTIAGTIVVLSVIHDAPISLQEIQWFAKVGISSLAVAGIFGTLTGKVFGD